MAPPAIPIIIAAAGAFVTGGIAGAGFFAASTLIGVGLTAALGVASTLLAPKAKKPAAQDFTARAQGQTVSADTSIAPWRIIYGETRVGIVPIYKGASDGNDKFHLVGAVACHEVNQFGTVFLNNRPVFASDLDADGVPSKGAFVNSGHNVKYLRVKTKPGTADQTAFDDLVAESSNGEWTADHRCRGNALLYLRFKFSPSIYASGIPNPSVVVQGKKVFDPRDDTTKWSPNPALCIRDYLLTPVSDGGFGAAEDEIDETSFEAAANACEEIVDSPTAGTAVATHGIVAVSASGDYIDLDGDRLKFQTGDRVTLDRSGSITRYVVVLHEVYDDGNESGDIRYPRIALATSYANALARTTEDLDGTETGPVTKTGEARYTLNGWISVDRGPRQIIDEMLTSCGGRLAYAGGKFYLQGLAWEAPDLELDESDLRGPIRVQTRVARRERFNAIKGTYVSPHNDWQVSDYPAVTNASYQALDQDIRIFREFDLPFTSRPGTAQRLAKLELARGRFERTAFLQCKLTAYDCKPGDVIAVTNSRFGCW